MTQQQPGATLRADATDWQLADAILRVPSTAQTANRPEEFLLQVARSLEELLTARVHIHWAADSPQPPPATEARHARLRVRQQDLPFATLDVLGSAPLADEARRALDLLTGSLNLYVDAITVRRVQELVLDLRSAMASGEDLEVVTKSTTEVAVKHMGAEAGQLLLRTSANFAALAVVGAWDDDPAAAERVTEAALLGLEAFLPLEHPGSLVSVPIASAKPARCVLVLRLAPGERIRSLTFPMLSELSSVTAPFLDARWRDRVFTELLELNHATEDISTQEMYGRVLSTALRLVPGADSGTLLTRSDPTAPFDYQAAVGFDLELLSHQPVSDEAARAWYGANDDGWHRGTPRILSRTNTNIEGVGAATNASVDPTAKQYDQIEATLCLPVLRDGNVMAVLNLDNLRDSGSLGADSAQLAYLFGAPLASLLHRQNTRDLLRKAALTDELTGLANRRAFNEALNRELERAQRSGLGPSVLHMDLTAFKAINDAYGHDVGDQVLIGVADAIRANIRSIDVAARYGGDEFMGLLVDTSEDAAVNVAERIRSAVAGLNVGLGPTRIDIGVASYASDGGDAARLMKVADERMYAAKRAAP